MSDDYEDSLLDDGDEGFFEQDGPALFSFEEPVPAPLPKGTPANAEAELPAVDEPEEVVVVPGVAQNEVGLSEAELAELDDDDDEFDPSLPDELVHEPSEPAVNAAHDPGAEEEPAAVEPEGDVPLAEPVEDVDPVGHVPLAREDDGSLSAPAGRAARVVDGRPGAPLALYRRYRPETFAEVIGQEHVTDPLQRALTNNKVNHAYLFSGPRGCGKTTSARILARCLNCEQGPTPNPCGVCQSCVELARGGTGSIDVIEIDAASHGGVDDARDLRERAFFAPVHSRYKIYIIDEAHMVTAQGFNAMLKLVEEPPPHVKFIFATTEPEKVIGTIRSRTHHYPFRLVPPKVLQNYLGELCEREGVQVDHAVLPLVVRAGAGSVRDSLSVLDQLLGGAADGGVTYEQASSLLGYTPDALLDEIMDAFAAGDSAGVFATIDKVMEVGQDPRRFAEDLLRRLRDLVIVAAVPDAVATGLIDVAGDQAERLQTQAAGMGQGELTRAAEVIARGLTDMRGTTAPRLHLELMCSRVLLPGADVDSRGVHARLDRLERRIGMAGAPEVADPAAGQWSEAELGGPVTTVPQAAAPVAEARQFATARPEPTRPEPAAPAPMAPQTSQAAAAPAVSAAPVEAPRAQRAPQAAPGQGQRPAGPPPGQRRPAPSPAAGGAPTPTPGAPASPAAPRRTDISVADVRRLWPQVLDEVKNRRRFAWIILSQNAQVLDVTDGVLTLGFANPGARDSFGSSGSQDVLRDCMVEVMGADLRIDGVVDPSGGPGGHGGTGQAGHGPSSGPNRGPQPRQGGAPGGGAASAPSAPQVVGRPASDDPGPSEPPPMDEPPEEPATHKWTEQAKQNIRPTAVSAASADEPEPEEEILVSRDDDTLDESGASAAELVMKVLGGEVIGED